MKTKLLIIFTLFTFNLFSQINLVQNNGFETWTNSTTLSDWTIENNVAQNTSSFTEGIKSAKLSITYSTYVPKIITQIPMKAGTTYTVKFKYKYVGTNYNSQHPIALNISQIGSATTLSSSTFATNNNWTVKETTFTPDQNMSYDLSISLFSFDAAAFAVNIDAVQVYVKDTEQYTLIPDANFENKLISLGIDSGIADGQVLTSDINKLTYLNVSLSSIADLTGIQDFTGLTYLDCSHNQLTTLSAPKGLALNNLVCSYNQLTSLDVSTNLGLKKLDCYTNQLATLNISYNVALTDLTCSYNQLSVLDVSNNPDLKSISCFNNQFTSLDVSSNVALTNLSCSNNKLTALNVSKNLALTYLDCGNNKLTALDVSKNPLLTELNCYNNKLVNLNLKNGNNFSLNTVYSRFTSNQYLTCIQVDDAAYSNTNWANIKDAAANYNVNCSLYTLIPDPKFEQKLIDLRIDTDGLNGSVLTSSINTVTEIDVSFSEITDLTGIQDFSALTKLFCGNNQLKNIDVSKNTALKQLMCESNTLTKLDVSKNAALTYLKCDKNQLTTLDVKINTALIYLSFSSNQITNIDVSKNTVLSNLFCSSNLLSNLDVSKNTALVALYCDSNQLTNIDISKNTILNYFYCDSNQLTNLNVSNNIVLSILTCASNQLTALDISKNTAVAVVLCNNNQLTSLNLKNGKNSISPASFDSTNNPNLKCIQVDDIVYANTNWITKKDTIASFNVDCKDLYTTIPDINFEKKLISLGIDVGVPDGKALTPNLASITSLDVSLSSISDLTGIQDFSALKFLKCNDNLLKNLDISKNTSLVDLFCFSNQIISLDVSNNIALINLSCYNNRLTNLNISKNTALVGLSCENNQLTTLNLKNGNNTILHFLNATNNPNLSCIQVDSVVYANANWITSKDAKASYNLDCTPYTLIPDSNFEQKLINLGIDTDGLNGKVLTYNISTVKFLDLTKSNISDLTGIQDFVSLTDLYCGQNSLTTLNISKNTALTTLDCNNNKITSLDVSNNIALLNLSCYSNQLTALDVKVNTALIKLDSGSNKYTTLDVSSNTALTFLGCNTSQLTSLDVSKNTALNLLDCRENKLTYLDVSKITTLTELYCQSNQLTNLDVSKNKALEFLNCSKNQLTTLDVSVNAALVGLYSNSNQLTSLNLKNANNVKFAYLNLIDNPNLSCIQVDDSNYFDTNWAAKKDKNASYNTNCTSYTQITDSKFEQKLIDLGIDTDGLNGKINNSGLDKITYLDLSNSNISDVKGLEAFTGLTYLDLNTNNIQSIDISHNKLLTKFAIHENKLSSLDITANTELFNLTFSMNQISTIDLSQNKKLHYVVADQNLLTNIDFSLNPELEMIYCGNNKLTTLNVSNLPNLLDLNCIYTDISTLDVTSNPKLVNLYFNNAKLTTLNLTKNPLLKRLQLSWNQLTTLDLSQNPNLELVFLEFNPLTSLNVQNGNNKNFILPSQSGKKSETAIYTSFLGNKTLGCIKVDDPAYSNANWSKIKEETTVYSATCSLGVEESVFDKVVVYPNPTKGEVNINNVALDKVTVYNTIGQLVKSFTLDSGNTNNSIDLSELPKGVYYLYLINQDAASAKKIIIE
jgi:Leucine-rich repeat (LRR) protein